MLKLATSISLVLVIGFIAIQASNRAPATETNRQPLVGDTAVDPAGLTREGARGLPVLDHPMH